MWIKEWCTRSSEDRGFPVVPKVLEHLVIANKRKKIVDGRDMNII
jgi:hypothetical protein